MSLGVCLSFLPVSSICDLCPVSCGCNLGLRLVSLPPLQPRPLSSSPILGSADPSRRLELELLLFLATCTPSFPSSTQASWGSGGTGQTWTAF